MPARHPRTEPGPAGESVWDYPRPPWLEPVRERLRAVFAGETIADTLSGFRVLETSHPPVYYIPPGDVRQQFLEPAPGRSFCEWKGEARYVALRVGARFAEAAGWFYPRPMPPFEAIAGFFAFYASRVDEAFVGAERVQAQPGDFYGGWITSRVAGPFKGGPGSQGW